jgi:glycosyltransferase involved in cell wall biosynthesis
MSEPNTLFFEKNTNNNPIDNPIQVSIVIIFFNMEKFIEESIQSAIDQTYRHWELLLVDDGSTDRSSEIAQQYAAKYPDRIYYLEHEAHQNKGKSTSRNLGIDRASGKYICFLDADDIFLPLKLEKQLAIIAAHPEVAMVYGNTLYWYSWTNNPEDASHDYLPELGIPLNIPIEPPSLVRLLLGASGAIPCICSFIIRRDFVNLVGGFDETIQHLYEDQVFLAKIFLRFPVLVEDGCWEKYRQRRDSSWHLSMSSGEDERARLVFLEWLEKHSIAYGFKDTTTWHLLQKQLWNYHHPLSSKLVKYVTTKLHYSIGRISRLKSAFKP